MFKSAPEKFIDTIKTHQKSHRLPGRKYPVDILSAKDITDKIKANRSINYREKTYLEELQEEYNAKNPKSSIKLLVTEELPLDELIKQKNYIYYPNYQVNIVPSPPPIKKISQEILKANTLIQERGYIGYRLEYKDNVTLPHLVVHIPPDKYVERPIKDDENIIDVIKSIPKAFPERTLEKTRMEKFASRLNRVIQFVSLGIALSILRWMSFMGMIPSRHKVAQHVNEPNQDGNNISLFPYIDDKVRVEDKHFEDIPLPSENYSDQPLKTTPRPVPPIMNKGNKSQDVDDKYKALISTQSEGIKESFNDDKNESTHNQEEGKPALPSTTGLFSNQRNTNEPDEDWLLDELEEDEKKEKQLNLHEGAKTAQF